MPAPFSVAESEERAAQRVEQPAAMRLARSTPIPLVAVHGNFASSRWFAPLVEEPPLGFRVYAWDLPGFGAHAHLGVSRPSIEHFADAVLATLGRHRLERPVLMGHSLGGAVVAEIARRQPSAVRGLVFVSSAPLEGLRLPVAHLQMLRLYRHHRALLEKALKALFVQALPPDLDLLVDDAMLMHPAAYVGNARALARWSVLEHLDALRSLPVLILGGAQDPLIRPGRVHAMAAHLPQARLRIVEGVGHCLPLEAPTLLRSELQGFAARLDP